MRGFQLTPQAIKDLDAIWWLIAEENRTLQFGSRRQFSPTCSGLTMYPRIGSKRRDITGLPVRFWTVTKFPNYVIVYRPETTPLQVVAILHGQRDLKEVLAGRLR